MFVFLTYSWHIYDIYLQVTSRPHLSAGEKYGARTWLYIPDDADMYGMPKNSAGWSHTRTKCRTRDPSQEPRQSAAVHKHLSPRTEKHGRPRWAQQVGTTAVGHPRCMPRCSPWLFSQGLCRGEHRGMYRGYSATVDHSLLRQAPRLIVAGHGSLRLPPQPTTANTMVDVRKCARPTAVAANTQAGKLWRGTP